MNQSYFEFKLVFESIIIGIFLLMGLLSFSRVFLLKRKSILYIIQGLICLALFLHTFLTGQTLDLFPKVLSGILLKVSTLSFIAVYPLFVFFIYFLFPVNIKLKHVLILSIIGIVIFIIGIVVPMSIILYIYLINYSIFLLTIIFFSYKLIQTMIRYKKSRMVWIISMISLMIVFIHEVLNILLKIDDYYWLPYGFAVYFVLLANVFLNNFIKDIMNSSKLLKELKKLQKESALIKKQKEELARSESSFVFLKMEIDQKKKAFLNKFTQREQEITNCLLSGDSYKVIASKFFISEHTVNVHIQNIYKKAEVRSKSQLINLFNSLSNVTEKISE